MAIYVKFAEEKKPKTVLEFLKLFYSRSINSYYCSGQFTYFDKECTNLQDTHSYRSFDDLLELTQTYYTSIKPVKLMHYLLILKINLTEGKLSKPHLATCSGMGRIRYIPYRDSAYLCISTKMSKSKYAWSELLIPLGISNEEEFLEYIK
jgi:hypothetical protein